jgi:hypothetical protein
MKQYGLIMVGLFAAGTATVAYAKMHTSSERDDTVAMCKTVLATNDIKIISPGLHDKGASDEDVDYALDMCFSYNAGMIAGLEKAKELYSK